MPVVGCHVQGPGVRAGAARGISGSAREVTLEHQVETLQKLVMKMNQNHLLQMKIMLKLMKNNKKN